MFLSGSCLCCSTHTFGFPSPDRFHFIWGPKNHHRISFTLATRRPYHAIEKVVAQFSPWLARLHLPQPRPLPHNCSSSAGPSRLATRHKHNQQSFGFEYVSLRSQKGQNTAVSRTATDKKRATFVSAPGLSKRRGLGSRFVTIL